MIGKNGGNFVTAHYEWIAAAVAAAALVWGGVVFFSSLGADPDALSSEKASLVKRMPPGGEKVQAADLTDFTRTSKVAKNPTSLSEVTDDKASFLASERRVFCEKCQAAIAADAKKCPVCGSEVKEEAKVVLDADGDGLPDVWEKKYGLNPNDAADAALDKDGDGFTNLEEFEAKTDPTDKTDHPDYLDSLTIQLPLKETVMPFYFTGTLKLPSGKVKFQFKDPKRSKEFDRGIYSVLADEEIGKISEKDAKSGEMFVTNAYASTFVPKEFVEKTVEKTISGGMKKKVDASEAIVVRKSDGKKVAMTIGKRGIPIDVQAKLVYMRGTRKEFDVVTGDVIDLNGTRYVVKGVAPAANNGAKVTLANEKTGKVRVLSAP